MSQPLPARPLYMRKTWDALLALFSFISILVAVGGMAWILFTVFERGSHAISPDFITNISRPVDDVKIEAPATPPTPAAAPMADDSGMDLGLSMDDMGMDIDSFIQSTYSLKPQDPVGIGNALLGTLAITLFATLITVPLAICAGIYLSEFGKGNKLADFLRFSANVLMGVPSIIIGVFIYVIVVTTTGCQSGFAGALALSVIMFPVVMRTTEDMMSMVPNTLRESALALGMTRMRTTLCIVARAAKNGLATGVLLSLARVSGETAPLLFTAMYADLWPSIQGFFSGPTANLPVLIRNYSNDAATEIAQNVGWGAAMVVCAFILIINILTRFAFRDTHKH